MMTQSYYARLAAAHRRGFWRGFWLATAAGAFIATTAALILATTWLRPAPIIHGSIKDQARITILEKTQ